MAWHRGARLDLTLGALLDLAKTSVALLIITCYEGALLIFSLDSGWLPDLTPCLELSRLRSFSTLC